MNFLSILLLFCTAFLGGISVFLLRRDHTKNLKLILSFSGSYLFAITVLHLIPEVYADGNRFTGIFVLLGFTLQLLLEQFSKGIEHGHIHKHEHGEYSFPLGVMLSICLHALLEGMPLGGDDHNHPLVFGIALHHIPAAFALGSVLLENHTGKKLTIGMLLIFALMTPAGILLSHSLESFPGMTSWFGSVMAVVIGMFLHISTTILFESSVDHRFNFYKGIAILTGASIALLNYLF